MDIELHPTISLLPETFNVLLAPVEMLVEAFNSQLNLQRYKILYTCGRSSSPAGWIAVCSPGNQLIS